MSNIEVMISSMAIWAVAKLASCTSQASCSAEGRNHAKHHGGYQPGSVLGNQSGNPAQGTGEEKTCNVRHLGGAAQTLPQIKSEFRCYSRWFDEPAKSDEQKEKRGNRINMGLR